ncbi:MAG: hypothetical protein SPG69_11130 [Bacteroides pyogenes]|uniref:hypothetical protein n=1 Tax=Bacteroides pyogenes TaxID=310300 RepID=UPI002A9123D7|nr:hypothetical protein [Bacteroides pyogenes]MDY5354549.1 hypothetical protein [Bacteroides pyogenes]
MPDMTITKKITDLKTLFNDVKEVYFKNSEIKTSDLGELALTVDMELPVLGDGVNFDTGSADVTPVKLTTGAIWTSKVSKGDPDISFQVASVDGAVNDLLMSKVKAIASAKGIINGNTYKGSAYSLAPKKVSGSLLMKSEDRQAIIILPKVEMYSSFVAADGDNPAYFNLSVTPMENSEGSDIMILSLSE